RDKQAFVDDLRPIAAFAGIAELPCSRTIVITGLSGNRRSDGLRSVRRAADLHQAHRGATNLGKRSVQDQPLVLQHPKSTEEKENSGSDAEQGNERQPSNAAA